MKKIALNYYFFMLIGLAFTLTACENDKNEEEPADPNKGTVQDVQGNSYPTIKIGDQWWMAENLNTTKFRTGEDIPEVAGEGEWVSLGNAAYCNPDNDTANAEVYGRLYNWHAATDGRKICPTGWHVPNDNDWATLTEFLGGNDVAGGKLKQTGTELWSSPNADATNESGFNAIPGGVRTGTSGDFAGMGTNASWWSVTQHNDDNAFTWGITSVNGIMAKYFLDKNNGLSIRCVKD
jgi:uncharacterized protein (TIGR02145 family)